MERKVINIEASTTMKTLGLRLAKIIPVVIADIIALSLGVQSVNAQSNVTSTSISYSSFKDPQGLFTIDYPTGWLVKPIENLFSYIDAEFSPNHIKTTSDAMAVDVRISDKNKKEFISNAKTSDKALDLMVVGLSEQLLGFDLTEGTNCDKYTLSDNKTCYVIYKRPFPSGPTEYGVMQVLTIIHGKMYLVSYTALPSVFDKNLPFAEHMINSFRVIE